MLSNLHYCCVLNSFPSMGGEQGKEQSERSVSGRTCRARMRLFNALFGTMAQVGVGSDRPSALVEISPGME